MKSFRFKLSKELQGAALLRQPWLLCPDGHRLFGVGIAQIAFYCEIFAETMQVQMADLGGLAHPGKASACQAEGMDPVPARILGA